LDGSRTPEWLTRAYLPPMAEANKQPKSMHVVGGKPCVPRLATTLLAPHPHTFNQASHRKIAHLRPGGRTFHQHSSPKGLVGEGLQTARGPSGDLAASGRHAPTLPSSLSPWSGPVTRLASRKSTAAPLVRRLSRQLPLRQGIEGRPISSGLVAPHRPQSRSRASPHDPRTIPASPAVRRDVTARTRLRGGAPLKQIGLLWPLELFLCVRTDGRGDGVSVLTEPAARGPWSKKHTPLGQQHRCLVIPSHSRAGGRGSPWKAVGRIRPGQSLGALKLFLQEVVPGSLLLAVLGPAGLVDPKAAAVTAATERHAQLLQEGVHACVEKSMKHQVRQLTPHPA
jgi:hypothetical protein